MQPGSWKVLCLLKRCFILSVAARREIYGSNRVKLHTFKGASRSELLTQSGYPVRRHALLAFYENIEMLRPGARTKPQTWLDCFIW
jgi:hypothetical protein